MLSYLDFDKLEAIDPAEFRHTKPYPWVNPEGLLTDEGFDRLLHKMPDLQRPLSQGAGAAFRCAKNQPPISLALHAQRLLGLATHGFRARARFAAVLFQFRR